MCVCVGVCAGQHHKRPFICPSKGTCFLYSLQPLILKRSFPYFVFSSSSSSYNFFYSFFNFSSCGHLCVLFVCTKNNNKNTRRSVCTIYLIRAHHNHKIKKRKKYKVSFQVNKHLTLFDVSHPSIDFSLVSLYSMHRFNICAHLVHRLACLANIVTKWPVI